MHLTLLVPGLLLPEEILENITYDLAAPTLSRLLGCSTRQDMPGDALADLFGLDSLPAAALRKLGAGRTAEGEWLCLDPVRWQVSPEGVTLDDPAKLALDAAENTALIEAMQPLFAEWGELSSSTPGCWELQLKRSLSLETRPLQSAIHQPIDPHQPGGADGVAWRRLLAESQTILHAHQVNHRRDEVGRPTVNSLWPWGQGSLPDRMQTGFTAVWGNDPVLAGLCQLAGIPCAATPARFQQTDGQVLASVETLATPARTFDALAWREALLDLERDWLAPAVKACQSLRVIGTRFGHVPATVAYTLKRSDRLRFWRKPRPLTELK
jgi:hypothetical protein